MRDDVIKYTWEQCEEMIEQIMERLLSQGKEISGVYGIPRSGIIPAVLIAYQYDMPLLAGPHKNCIIIDGDCWSGKQLSHYARSDEQEWEYHICALIDRSEANTGKPSLVQYAGITLNEVIPLIVFPWNAKVSPYAEPWLFFTSPEEHIAKGDCKKCVWDVDICTDEEQCYADYIKLRRDCPLCHGKSNHESCPNCKTLSVKR